MRQPYVYRVRAKDGRFYYGCRFSNTCNPADFWVKYYTSSNTVKSIIEEHGKDYFDIKIVFVADTTEEVLRLESLLISKTYRSPFSMNKFMCDRDGNPVYLSMTEHEEATKSKISSALNSFYCGMSEEQKAEWLSKRKRISDVSGYRKSKLGKLNPNYGKDLTNSFTLEQRAKQKENAQKGMLVKMPWEKGKWNPENDAYWSKADLLMQSLKTMKRAEALMHVYGTKDLKAFNATNSIIERFNKGWEPLKCPKWIERYGSSE
ncbi:putative homing endonuclease F-LimVI [Dickeya phage JA15]|uniref:Homing endonuclease n=9 Tax=Limestonevirus limestone TaxID=1091052 RepID=A0A7L4YE09_9CAUD|nr:putative homing endonuclease F-LimVI [Dickeya phage JA15]ASD51496.1 putative homing endonuclease F-LimVI [Dickeya phage XF4]ATW62116.1 putative homing endonuclease [Dickeya phage PP35]QHB41620.1 hypothetical protein [Dickeya phage Ds5CZ]QHB41822.1 hypothetical protein [Dickeya phage Ds9CZ]QHB42025.1 hypothetical protein [Dickeya phage Ds16CZ]QHB42228.1 hypothetical protein [Dickeya phage Ds20CZ]QHB42425.1 hypothetical protein [Dickeya phage Ds23CZ]QHB42855.1 hypothetical protein [Dickeya